MVGVLALLAAIGIGLFIFLGVRAVRDADFTIDDSGFEPLGNGETYGDDPELDALWDQCDEGDMGACDELYLRTPIGSEYEEFGQTCGGTSDTGTGGLCTQDTGGATPGTLPDGEADAYGDDPTLDALWDGCDNGDMAACDDLFFQSPFGSEYEEFGASCGNTRPGETGLCDEGS